MKDSKIINIISNRNLESKKTSEELKKKLLEKGFNVFYDFNPEAELNICVGGDGSFLKAVHVNNFPSIPFIGINTGHLGFFQEICPSKIDLFLENYLNKKFIVDRISLVEAKIQTKKKAFFLTAINEIVIKGGYSKVINIDMSIDGNFLQKFCGDGIIVSTPVGSTAHNFSAGGSIIFPSLKTMQVTPLSPINSQVYRSLHSSLVVPGYSKLLLHPKNPYGNTIMIVNDGKEFKYTDVEYVSFTMSKKKISRLIFNDNFYWNNLRNKFL